MNRENQHFVPKAFLKHFCHDRKANLFQSRFIEYTGKWDKPRTRHINSICYDDNIYNLNPNFAKNQTISPDFVERNAFWYEKGFMDELLNKINSDTIQKEDIKKIPDFYLSMTARNPVFLSGFDPSKIEKTLDAEIAKMREHSAWVKKMAKLKTSNEIDDFFLNLRKGILEENTQQNMYSKSLYNQHQGESEIYNNIRDKISKYKVVIGKIEDDDQFFITNDFPGFSMCERGLLHSLKFKGDVFHYMPLSSKIVITLLHPVYAFNEPNLKIGIVNKKDIDFINNGTIKTSREYIFCENKDFLSNLLIDEKSK